MIRPLLIALIGISVAGAAEIQPPFERINAARIRFGYDTDAQDFFARVASSGGSTGAATRTAVNAFVVSAKANGYWTKLVRINLFCGDQLAAALVPLKSGPGSSTDTNNNFVAGDYSEATGLTGNGSTKYLNTGLLANALTANSTHLAVYNRGSVAFAQVVMGASDAGGTTSISLLAPYTTTYYSDQYDQANGRVSVATAGTPFGFVLGTRVASNDHKIYRNGSQVATSALSGGTLPALAIYVYGSNTDGSLTLPAAYNLGAYSIGSGLTAANVTAFNTDLEAFQDALGRGVQ